MSESDAGEMPTTRASSDAETSSAFSRRAGVLLALFITGFGTFVNLYATQPLLPRFREIFHASELMVSLTVSAPILAVALTAPLVGLLADNVGRKRVIVVAMLGLAVATFLAGTADNLPHLIAWRFAQGLFIPGIIAVAMAYISEESPRDVVGSTMSVYVSGTVVGGFAGRFLTGVIVSRWEWHVAFEALGILAMLGGLLTWWLLPRSKRFVRQSNALAAVRSMGAHLRNPQLLATYAVGFNVLFALVGVFTYVNFYLSDGPFWLGPAALASVFGVYLIGAVVTPFAGRVLDRIGYRRGLIVAAGMAAGGTLLTLIPSLPVVIGGLAMGASGAFICQSAASSHVGKAAKEARSSASGLYVALYYLGGCAGSILPGVIWHRGGWTGCVAMMVAMQTVTAGIAYRLWRE